MFVIVFLVVYIVLYWIIFVSSFGGKEVYINKKNYVIYDYD